MFRGSAPAKIDDKGRLKVPTPFRVHLEERWGPEIFATSVRGDSARIYPLAEWEEIEGRLAAMPSTHPARTKFLERVNYYGQQARLDAQGRIVVPQILRESAEIVGEVVVSGRITYLEVWNRERFAEKLAREDFTEDDFGALSDLGI
ncbi:MAG TPA: division/cell wall cluster transcriptional repressor MraZ [Thermoanaerobaculia bacterium]|jgi:MraZ protein|nr:division/cell wall cluster transcriptional repressor MraZ [Thermoanaerobaculia bacterium]